MIKTMSFFRNNGMSSFHFLTKPSVETLVGRTKKLDARISSECQHHLKLWKGLISFSAQQHGRPPWTLLWTPKKTRQHYLRTMFSRDGQWSFKPRFRPNVRIALKFHKQSSFSQQTNMGAVHNHRSEPSVPLSSRCYLQPWYLRVNKGLSSQDFKRMSARSSGLRSTIHFVSGISASLDPSVPATPILRPLRGSKSS